MEQDSKIYVAGHTGLVGSALVKNLRSAGYTKIVVKTRPELDLADQTAVRDFFYSEHPDYIFLAAAKVGGIMANQNFPADFIYDNLVIAANVIRVAYEHNVKKLLFMGSSCIYPKLAAQPIKEEYLLNGKLESTNEPYAVAKIAGIKMCQAFNRQYGTNFISVMPTNLYGPGDNFDSESAHVLPAMIKKFHEAKNNEQSTVTLWGSGAPRREFLHVDDLAEACRFLMENYNDSEIINIGTGEDITIRELAELIKDITGFKGKIIWDQSKPDGTPRKLLDVSKLRNLGWRHKIDLKEGIATTYNWFLNN